MLFLEVWRKGGIVMNASNMSSPEAVAEGQP